MCGFHTLLEISLDATLLCWSFTAYSWLLPQYGGIDGILLFFCLVSPFDLHAWSSTSLTVGDEAGAI